ncbi:MAG: peptide/nickel transport system permease protein [Thermomicrobiales bacterium]|nr:peptide/nickel transport system permease protein [Thermomicrobiales bacterium]
MRLLRYALRRLLLLVPVLLGALFIAFLLTRIVPGDPIERVAGPYASDEEVDRLRREANLDRPFYVQFVIYLGDLARGDLGDSFYTGQPVKSDLSSRFPATFEVVLYGMLFAILLAIPLGMLSAVMRGHALDHLSRVLSVLGVSVPVFWIGLVLLTVFYNKLEWLPGPTGRLPIGMDEPEKITGLYTVDALLRGEWTLFWEATKALILPVVTIGVTAMAPIARMTRSTMIDALDSDYVRTSRSLGIPGRVIVLHHAFKNAILPVLTLIAAVFGFLVGGEVLVEIIFSWNGLGLYSYNAILNSDFPAIQGFILLVTAIYILIYLAVDIITALIDPRVEF